MGRAGLIEKCCGSVCFFFIIVNGGVAGRVGSGQVGFKQLKIKSGWADHEVLRVWSGCRSSLYTEVNKVKHQKVQLCGKHCWQPHKLCSYFSLARAMPGSSASLKYKTIV